MVSNVCAWANQFQAIRQEYWKNAVAAGGKANFNDDCFAPVMILYTKCPELEGAGEKTKHSAPIDRIKYSYIFRDERNAISKNQVYGAVGQQFENYDNLKNVYISRLRCSPYGFPALPNDEAEGRLPEPSNVDLLMRWILAVTGCIDPEATYYPDHDDPHKTFSVSNNFISRAQYRAQVPVGTGNDGDVHEALNRCFLFENPGKVDELLVPNYDNWAELAKIRTKVYLGRIRNS
jgi:hypothetical protein